MGGAKMIGPYPGSAPARRETGGWRLLLAALLLAISVVGLAACSGGAGPAPPPPTPPPGIMPSYVGSAVCIGCHSATHPQEIADWTASGHRVMVTTVAGGPGPDKPLVTSPPAGYAWNQISYIVGGFRSRAVFLDTNGNVVSGPQAQFNVGSGLLELYPDPALYPHQGTGIPTTTDYDCGACHTTGWVPSTTVHQDGRPGIMGTWAEPGVGCEACHGPGGFHAGLCTSCHWEGNIVLDRSSELCSQCHPDQYATQMVTRHRDIVCADCHEPHMRLEMAGPLSPWSACDGCHPGKVSGPPHDGSNNVDCGDCHFPHQPPGLLARGAAQQTLCEACHFAVGPPPMAGFVNHTVNGGATVLDCGTCHDPHGSHDSDNSAHGGGVAANRSLVRTDTAKYTSSSTVEPAVFQLRPDHFAFGTAPFNGVCQTCHTQTTYHRNDGTGVAHQAGVDCITCHPHEQGFLPQGCTACHDVPRGPRRTIVGGAGDFSLSSTHVGAAVVDADCTVCHVTTGHTGGTVTLRNPDGGPAITYDPANFSSAETQCLNCHDGDGATSQPTPMQPLSVAVPPADVEGGGAWAASMHANNTSAFNGGNPLTCLGLGLAGCHYTAHGSDFAPILGLGATGNAACLTCHNGAILPSMTILGAHDDGTPPDLLCVDCHDVHQDPDGVAAYSRCVICHPGKGGGSATEHGGGAPCGTCHPVH